MSLEVVIEDARWADLGLPALAERAFDRALLHLGLGARAATASLLGCDDARIAALNAAFRDKPAATNVLSWPAQTLGAAADGGRPAPPDADFSGEIALGDIALAYETCAREAAAGGLALADHATHLVVHGLLHLLGYDHMRDRDATVMETLETEILGSLGLDDPYRGL